MYAWLWKHANIFTSKKLVSTFPQRAGIPGSTSWSHGPGWALDMAPPHAAGVRWKLLTGVWGWLCQGSLAGALQTGCPCPGEAMAQHGIFYTCGTGQLWWMRALCSALGLSCAASATAWELGTDVSLHCQRGWDLTLSQEAAQDRSVQTHRSCGIAGARHTVAHRTLINIVGFSLWRYRAIAGLTNTDN